jgi:hypothetical protein
MEQRECSHVGCFFLNLDFLMEYMLWTRLEQSLPEADLACHSEVEFNVVGDLDTVSLWFFNAGGNVEKKFLFLIRSYR